MKKVTQGNLNLFILAIHFAERGAEKINNANVSIKTLESADEVDEKGLARAKETLRIEQAKLDKYNKVIDYFDNKYFN